jgi:hypothetical protein
MNARTGRSCKSGVGQRFLLFGCALRCYEAPIGYRKKSGNRIARMIGARIAILRNRAIVSYISVSLCRHVVASPSD